MRKLFFVGGFFVLLSILYFTGPKPRPISESSVIEFKDYNLYTLDSVIKSSEAKFPVRSENEAEIVWADSAGRRTEYSIVYLHGFSASKREGDPVHRELARELGANLYLARLYDHGIDEEEPMLDLTADKLIATAKEAVSIGKALGEKLIVVGTSTGGTLGLLLAAENPEIDALVLYSPNIRVYNPMAGILNDPWGLQIAHLVNGSDYHEWVIEEERANFWINRYRYEALTELQQLLEEKMNSETFKKVNQPVFVGYYYKSEDEQDKTVSVEAILEMYDNLGSAQKLKKAFPDAGAHVIASDLTSASWEDVRNETLIFLKDNLQ